jgi:hypothetical protein
VKQTHWKLKKYLVAIPVPFLDDRGRKLKRRQMQMWVRLVEQELTECFGGATPIASPGTNIIEGQILYEQGQTLILSACDNRREFLKKRDRIAALVERMGNDLNQHAVFVLAFPSDSFLIEIEKASPSETDKS